jgi:N6-L-threonylcarbamoyladenine synthase
VLILGIETSCDETSAALVERRADPVRPWHIRSNIVASQDHVHREWGGVVPELAARQHVRDICPVVERALADGGAGWPDLGAIAVTKGPGLVGSLLVGVAFAKSLAYSLQIPLVPVHHLVGHIESLFLEHGPLELPSVVLVVSGGHTSLFEVPEPGVYRLLGRTRDDAAGEAYDKVAKLLGLGYPGGPVIDRLAATGDDRAVELSVARMTHADRNAPWLRGDLDFSFSGLKTAVLRHVRDAGESVNAADVAASFQRVVVESLVERVFDAADRARARSVGIAGGVSANSRLRRDAAARGARLGLPVYMPSLKLSTDNAAMIAAAGLRALEAGVTAGWDLNADASLPVESLAAREADREPL